MEFFAGILVGLAAWPAFWVAFVIIALGLSAFIVNERGGWATLFTLGLGVMVAAQWKEILTNPLPLLIGALAYLVIGVLWSRFKWSRFLTTKFSKYADARDTFMKLKGLDKDQLNALKHTALDEYVNLLRIETGERYVGDSTATTMTEYHASLTPKAATNKGSIVMWIVYWPITAIWYIIADIVTDIAKGLYNMVGGHFQKMSNEKFNQL